MRTTLIVILIIILGIGAYFFIRNEMPGTAQDPETMDEMRVYESDMHGFSFEYPPEYEVNEYTPQNIAIGNSTGEGFNSVAEVSMLLDEPGSSYMSYEQFLADRTRVMCAADGLSKSISCTGVEQGAQFESNSGLTGFMFFLTEETQDLTTGATTTAAKGPFFGFNISANVPQRQYAALVVHPPIALPPEEVDRQLVRSIAESVEVNRVETR